MIMLSNDKLRADRIFWMRLLEWRLSYKEVKRREVERHYRKNGG